MGDEAVKREAPRLDQPDHLGEISVPPRGRDPDSRLAHERGREAEAHAIVEPGEHDFAAGTQPLRAAESRIEASPLTSKTVW